MRRKQTASSSVLLIATALGACNLILGNEAGSSVVERDSEATPAPDGATASSSSSSSGSAPADAQFDVPPGVSACADWPGCEELGGIAPGATALAVSATHVFWVAALESEQQIHSRPLSDPNAQPQPLNRVRQVAALAANENHVYAFMPGDSNMIHLHELVDHDFVRVLENGSAELRGWTALPEGIAWSWNLENSYLNTRIGTAIHSAGLAVGAMAANLTHIAALMPPPQQQPPQRPDQIALFAQAQLNSLATQNRIDVVCDGGEPALALSDRHLFLTGCCPDGGICSMPIPLSEPAEPLPNTLVTAHAGSGVAKLYASGSALFFSRPEASDGVATWRCSITADGVCTEPHLIVDEVAVAYARNDAAVYLLTPSRVLRIPH